MEELLTIGIPTKNSSWCLPRLLKAIEELEYPKEMLKIIFVDDFSTDNTWKIINKWASLNRGVFYKISLIKKRTNIPQARNVCLSNAEGSYILFWDSDVIPPRNDFLKYLMKIMHERLNIGAISCPYIFEGDKNFHKKFILPKSRYTRAACLGFALIRRSVFSIIGGFNEDLEVGEDTEFFIRMNGKTDYKLMRPQKPCLHLQRPKSFIKDYNRSFMAWLRYNFSTRGEQYFRQFKNLPILLKLRVLYYFLLPFHLVILILSTMSIASFTLFNIIISPWLVKILLVLYLLPLIILTYQDVGSVTGTVKLIIPRIFTGIALAWGFFRATLKALYQKPKNAFS